jgi:ATP-dependent Lhr-like helicase
LAAKPGADATRRKHAWAEQLLRRHGVISRGALTAERAPGGFTGIYPVLSALEDSGRCRRGYFVEGLGGAQFALPGAVDRLRSLADDERAKHLAIVLAATDPANPYGASLPWPERRDGEATHRAGRKAGAAVVLVGGQLILYLERGGKTLLSYSTDETILATAIGALANAVRGKLLARIDLERVDGGAVQDTPLAPALLAVGFQSTYRGLQLRA